MIKRKYFEIVEKELNNKQITALIGSRQVGKTTLLENIYEKNKEISIFLTLDNVEVLNLFENELEIFIKRYIEPYNIIFIDEIQYSKNSGKNLKYIYDKYKKKIYVSGSSTPEMAINSLQYLVGRVNIIEIKPISFEEFVRYKRKEDLFLLEDIKKQSNLKLLDLLFEEFLKFGSYPLILTLKNQKEKEKELTNLVNTYLLKEIKEILNFRNLFDFEKLLKRFALSDGGITNKSSFSSELEINRVKFNEMYSTLINTYILNQVQPYYSNKIKELIKSSKIYFSDLGFKNSLIKNFNDLELRQDKGEIYESFILSELKKENFDVFFWNYENRFEVDFCVEKNDNLIGFEIKSNLSSDNLPDSVKKFIDLQNPKEIYIFNNKIDSIREYNGVKIIFTNYINIVPIMKYLKKKYGFI